MKCGCDLGQNTLPRPTTDMIMEDFVTVLGQYENFIRAELKS